MTTTSTLPTTREGYEAIVEQYGALRSRCYELARADSGALMGRYAWLRHALGEHELELYPGPEGIDCSGSTYTTQTQCNEWFDFTIPYSALEKQ